MKKIIALLLAVVMAFSLVACSNDSNVIGEYAEKLNEAFANEDFGGTTEVDITAEGTTLVYTYKLLGVSSEDENVDFDTMATGLEAELEKNITEETLAQIKVECPPLEKIEYRYNTSDGESVATVEFDIK